MVATAVHAKSLVDKKPSDRSPYQLAEVFCRQARTRIRERFDHLFANNDAVTYRIAQEAMEGRFEWLEEGLLNVDWTPPQTDGGAEDESTGESASDQSSGDHESASIRETAGHA